MITSPRAIVWLTGYFALPTERPFALVVPQRGGPFAFVPGVEWEAAAQVPTLEEVWRYYEYPGPLPPLSRNSSPGWNWSWIQGW
ncbi:aminopeptidase P family N-terminal domain-containing protein [Candidatus Bipolaricaulota bacterium]|nr:aminopeptidase P family N-terminal domain-containing protein [Candidatus Bipolaricaulota bacterium]